MKQVFIFRITNPQNPDSITIIAPVRAQTEQEAWQIINRKRNYKGCNIELRTGRAL